MNYSDLEQDLQAYIVQRDDFEAWAIALEERVVPWIREQGNKGLWDVVSIVSQRIGVVKPRLARGKFAKLVVRICPSLKGESAKTLRASMEKGGNNYSSGDKKNYDKLSDEKWLKKYGLVIERLLKGEGCCVTTQPKPIEGIAKYLEATLRLTMREEEHAPCSRIRQGRIYEQGKEYSVQPTISLEQYSSDEFLAEGRPSFIVAYECFERQVTREDVKRLCYDYKAFQAMKLVLVSPVGFPADVISSCDNNNIGLIRAKEDGQISHVLPRSLNDYVVLKAQREALGGGEMEGQMLLMDYCIFHSLGFWLKGMGFPVKKEALPRVPYHPKDEIIRRVEALRDQLWISGEFEVRGMDKIASRNHLSIQFNELPEQQLGRLDLQQRAIILSSTIKQDYHRARFTLAHELGHFFLHADAMRGHLLSFGETDKILNGQYNEGNEMRWLEYQANIFASVMLMPEAHVKELAARFFNERELRAGYIWYDDQPVNMQRCNYVLGQMSEAMNVSKMAVKLRMKKLGLLKEGSSSKRVRDLL